MRQYRSVMQKEKAIPVAGVILLYVFAVNIILGSFYYIARAFGYPIFIYYKWLFTVLVIADFFPGLLLFPTLLIIFLIQAIRFRKNQCYLKNCIAVICGGILIFIAGSLITNFVEPVAIEKIDDIKIKIYETIVDKVHCKDSKKQHGVLTGGMIGNEDVAFYQYTVEEEIEHVYYVTDFYILYSEDNICDIEEIKKGKGNRGKGVLSVQSKEKNWYLLKATYIPAQ